MPSCDIIAPASQKYILNTILIIHGFCCSVDPQNVLQGYRYHCTCILQYRLLLEPLSMNWELNKIPKKHWCSRILMELQHVQYCINYLDKVPCTRFLCFFVALILCLVKELYVLELLFCREPVRWWRWSESSDKQQGGHWWWRR